MKKFVILTIAMISLFMYAEKSRADLLVEPYLGLGVGGNIDQDNASDNDFSTVLLGGRLGFQTLGLQLGIDYRQGTLDIDTSSNADSGDFNQLGAFVGYEFPILVRVYAEYIFSSKLDVDNGPEYRDPSGTSLGVGFTGLPFIDINFEMTSIKYDKLKASGGSEFNVGTDVKYFLIGVSAPFNF